MRRSVRLTCFRINPAVDVTAVALKIIRALHVAYCSPVAANYRNDVIPSFGTAAYDFSERKGIKSVATGR